MANFYVSTDGDDANSGVSIDQPLATLEAAHEQVSAGDTIFLRGGIYDLQKDTSTVLSKSGTQDAPIRLMAYEDEQPIIRGEGWTPEIRKVLVIQTGDYWHVEGLEITDGPFLGYLADGVEGSVFKDLNIHGNGNTGFNLTGESNNNLILGGDFHHNFDPAQNGQDADGIAIKFGSGEGNVVDGVRMFNNSDDGIDLWNFEGSVTIKNSMAFGHGVDRWDHGPSFEGNGNGFKLTGGDASAATNVAHVVEGNIAWDNTSRGFDYNGSQGAMQVVNNTSNDNGFAGFFFQGGAHTLRNNLSFDNGVDHLTASSVDDAGNSWNLDVEIDAADFESLDGGDAADPRAADGSIPESGFLRLVENSDLIDAGTDVGRAFTGEAPDLGAFETPAATPGVVQGRYFTDLDGDGGFDMAEPAASGNRVDLLRRSEQTPVASTLTNALGLFVFLDVPPADDYFVRFFRQQDDAPFIVPDGETIGEAGNLNTATFSLSEGETVVRDAVLATQIEAPEGTDDPAAPDPEDPMNEPPDESAPPPPEAPTSEEEAPDEGDQNQVLEGGADNNTLTAGEGDDALYGGVGDDNLKGHGGDDTLKGGDGNDVLVGNKGDDVLRGGAGNDWLKGGLDDDALFGNQGADILRGGAGDDSAKGGQSNDLIVGGGGADALFGGGGNDLIRGSGGADALNGGGGADLLIGGAGNDTMTGGRGQDVFAFNDNSGADHITDFVSGVDQIRLSGAAFDQLEFTESDADLLITNGNLTILLEDTQASEISQSDFVF